MKKRIVAIDYGVARIGLAYSDDNQVIAFPLQVVKADKKSAKTVLLVAAALAAHQKEFKYEIEEIIIGLPLMMSGKSGMMVDEVNHFITLLEKTFPGIPVTPWDERLTSVMADRALRESTMTRKKRAQFSDTVAATLILQNYLDYKHLRG